MIQLDNTAKQNKSKFIFGFLGHLIAASVVQEVIVSFLQSGHTHEDVDQLFSRTSGALKRNDAVNMLQMMDVISLVSVRLLYVWP